MTSEEIDYNIFCSVNTNILPEKLRRYAVGQIEKLEAEDDKYLKILGYYYLKLTLECEKAMVK